MKDKLNECIDWLKTKKVDYADCRYVRRERESIKVSDSAVESFSRDLDVGVGIRVIADGAWGFAAPVPSCLDGRIILRLFDSSFSTRIDIFCRS